MFKFLKEKLKNAVDKFSKDIDENAETIEEIAEVEEKIKKTEKESTTKSKADTKEKKSKKKTEEKKEQKERKQSTDSKKDLAKKVKQQSTADQEENATSTKQKQSSAKVVDETSTKSKGKKNSKDSKKTTKSAQEEVSDDLEAEAKEIVEEARDIEEKVTKETKKGFFSRLFKKEEESSSQESSTEDTLQEMVVEEDKDDTQKKSDVESENAEEELETKKGFFSRVKESITTKKLSESKFDDLFFDLEIVLLENNVALEVIEKIKNDMKERLVDKKINRSEIGTIVFEQLRSSLDEILTFETIDIFEKVKEKKPYVIVFVGINGTGKTTTIAKLAHAFKQKGLTPVLVAADTFRAAAIQQLEEHAKNLGVKLIKHDYGSDPAAVAFDGIKHAKEKGADVVLIDTAGRLHSNTNLMGEMEKIIRVAKPDLKIFVGESTTGNDCVDQARKFNEIINIDGIVLSKADVDEKGGAAISAAFVTGKPILFIGTGQGYDDLEPFDKDKLMKRLFE